MPAAADLSASSVLNRHCHCRTSDVPRIHEWIERHLMAHGIHEPLVRTHPYLFSETPVFIGQKHIDDTAALIAAIESVVRAPAYQELVLADAPPAARIDNGSAGVLYSYDFHLDADGPKLIEINTNAGGALLNLVMLRAQIACCPESLPFPTEQSADRVETALLAMFQREWTLARADSAPLRRIAIVDDAPSSQFLYPEFLLFKRLFESHGWETVIADPETLRFDSGKLQHDRGAIDLVYNRLTDFYLENPQHAHLAEAHRLGAVVVTPHPRAHALYANKRNLTLLSDERELSALGVPPTTIRTLLSYVPKTRVVATTGRDEWWSDRKEWFFKPSSGYAARGAYRGDKITRRAFADVVDGSYVAQTIVPAGVRYLARESEPLRWDLRVYVYEGRPLLHAARLYSGQTTNFRTPGGGFAPVFCINDSP